MKKRFLALFLCCVMVFTLLPAALTTAFADGQTNEEQSAPAQETTDVVPGDTGDLDVQPDGEQDKQDEQPVACTCNAAEGAAHAEGCPLYVAPEQGKDGQDKQDEQPVACTCGAAEGAAHAEDCPLYVAPEPGKDEQDKQDEQPVACTCGAAEGAAHAEDCPLYVAPEQDKEEQEQPDAFQTLYDRLMATSSLEEFAEICDACEEGELAQFEKWAEENDLLDALRGHISDITPEYEVPETVVFTDAGPFLPAVLVPTAGRLLRAPARGTTNGGGNTEGLVLSKKATVNSDGSYKIRLEAHTTGTVTTSTTIVPMDVVLVLDQSGSMAYDFSGNTTYTNTKRRQYAMKEAVKGFIDAVAEKYSDTADHRMALVTFGSNASTLLGWTNVDTTGQNTLKNRISRLPDKPEGATNAKAGMDEAVKLMGSGYAYSGSNATRQKVVIFFTDGVPTTESTFSTSVADGAIRAANTLKAGGATVYALGIFTGVNPNEMYGASGFDQNSDGTIGSYWQSTSKANTERPAGNRFLNLLSSNYKDANTVGLKLDEDVLEYDFWGYPTKVKYTYTITENFTRTANASDHYYLSANDDQQLKDIFTSISNNIQNASIDLGAQTVVKDIVSPYFTVPANTSDIKLYTAAYQGNGSWAAPVAATATSGPNATITGKTVSVTGFDFNANFISENPKTDGTRGSKLIIEFTVNPEPGFLGGNGVPTNGSDSGVYDKDGNEVKKFDVPTVNVPIKDVTVNAVDKNVYLLGNVTENDCKTDATAMCNGVDLLKTSEYTGENAWKADYVKITTNVTKPTTALTADGTYTISVKVEPEPLKPGIVPPTGAEATAKTGEKTANINVFKPELTFKDTEAYYGAAVPENLESNLKSTEWKHGETVADPSTMLGTKPELTITCAPDDSKILNGKINTTEDIGVAVTVKIGDTDVTKPHTTFKHEKCNQTCELPEGYQFLIHVKTCTLTVKKELAAGTAIDDGQSFIFTITGPGIAKRVVIQGNGSVTLKGLKVGEYTVTEDTAWSWRYTPQGGAEKTATLSAAKDSDEVTFVNTLEKEKWVSTDVYCKNEFKDSGIKTIINGNGKTVNGNPVNN